MDHTESSQAVADISKVRSVLFRGRARGTDRHWLPETSEDGEGRLIENNDSAVSNRIEQQPVPRVQAYLSDLLAPHPGTLVGHRPGGHWSQRRNAARFADRAGTILAAMHHQGLSVRQVKRRQHEGTFRRPN